MSILVKTENGMVEITQAEFLERHRDNKHVRHFSEANIIKIFEHIEELQDFDGPPNAHSRHNYNDWTLYFQDASQDSDGELTIC